MPRLKLYRVHWSDNRNQLGEPHAATSVAEDWPAPWVYLFAPSLRSAKQRVTEFNATCEPVEPALRPACIPVARLAEHHMTTRFATRQEMTA
jgi:hypothetical protein